MANKRYTANEQLKARADFGSRPAPGVEGVKRQALAEKTANWAGAPGPKGTGYNPGRLGFKEIKTHVKQDLGDDEGDLGGIFGMVGSVVGSIIGGIYGGPAGAQIGSMAGSQGGKDIGGFIENPGENWSNLIIPPDMRQK